MVTSKYSEWQVGQKFARIGEYCRNELFPITCGICGQVGVNLCLNCLVKLPTNWATTNHPLISRLPVYYLKKYDDEFARDLIGAIKFRGRPDLLPEVINRVGGYLFSGQNYGLVPVPITRWHLATRGYNQAQLFADALAARTDLEVLDCLRWSFSSLVWDSIAADRTTRLKTRLVYVRKSSVKKKKVILVDDVLTTGATTRDCIAALNIVGVEVTGLIVLAVTPKLI